MNIAWLLTKSHVTSYLSYSLSPFLTVKCGHSRSKCLQFFLNTTLLVDKFKTPFMAFFLFLFLFQNTHRYDSSFLDCPLYQCPSHFLELLFAGFSEFFFWVFYGICVFQLLFLVHQCNELGWWVGFVLGSWSRRFCVRFMLCPR